MPPFHWIGTIPNDFEHAVRSGAPFGLVNATGCRCNHPWFARLSADRNLMLG